MTQPENNFDPSKLDERFENINSEIGSLKDTLGGINETLTGLNDVIQEAAKAGEEPESNNQNTGWMPKSWDEIPERAEEVARKAAADVLEEKQRAEQEALKQREEEEQKTEAELEREINDQVKGLETSGFLAKEGTDEGKAQRRELFGFAAHQNTADLMAVSETLSEMHAAGRVFDPDSKKFLKANQMPSGANAPVGSSSSTTGYNDTKPSVKDIRKFRDMDEIVSKFERGEI